MRNLDQLAILEHVVHLGSCLNGKHIALGAADDERRRLDFGELYPRRVGHLAAAVSTDATPPIMLPRPASVFELLEVVQETATDLRLWTSRVETSYALDQPIEGLEGLGAFEKFANVATPLRLHVRADVNHYKALDFCRV